MQIRVALGASVLVVAGLAGCGGTDTVTQEKPTPVAAVKQAVERADTESYRFDMKVTGDAFNGTGEGEYRAGPNPASRVTMKLGPRGIGGGSFEFVTIGKDSWSRFGSDAKAPAGILGFAAGKWMKSSDGPLGEEDSDEFDVRKQVQLLVAATDLREIGPEQIDGAETTHYSGTATPETVSAATEIDPKTKADLIQEMEDEKEPALLEVWLDRDQRIRRFVQSGTDGDGKYRASVDFRDFGAAIDIAAPRAKDVVDFGDLGAPAVDPKQQAKLMKQFFESMSKSERREFCRSIEAGGPVSDEDDMGLAPPAEFKKLCAANN